MDVIVSGTTRARTSSPSGWQRGFVCLAAVALAQAAVGIYWLVARARASEPGQYQAAAGSLFLVLALVQLLRLGRAWRARAALDPQRLLGQGGFWGMHLIGVVMAHSAALALGPTTDVAYFFAMLLATQYTLAGFWVLVSRTAAVRVTPWLTSRQLRATGAITAAAVAGLMTLELSLWIRDNPISRFGAGDLDRIGLSTASAADLGGVDSLRDAVRLAAPKSTLRRGLPEGNPQVAIVDTASGSQAVRFLPLLEEQVQGTRLRVAATGDASVEKIATACFADAAWRQPNLVLLFVTIDHRLTSRAAPAGWFDWRAWRVATMFVADSGAAPAPADEMEVAEMPEQQHEQYLRDALRSLRLCRVEADDAVDQTWQDLWRRLAGLNRHCAGRGVELALVAVPAEFQVRTDLCGVLRRRGGFQAEEIDVELPQRRLAAFAHEQGLPIIDLLPHLRAAQAPVFERHAQRLNAAGNRVAADTLARWLSLRYGQPETPVAQAGGR